MKSFVVEFTEEEFKKFSPKKLTEEQTKLILQNMSIGVKAAMIDEPHYVFDDYVETVLTQ